MLVQLTIYQLAAQLKGVRALPLLVPEPSNTHHIDLRSESNSDCTDLSQCRTIWSIIWSCSATIFACTWIALHLNIPSRDETWIQLASRRVGIMIMALVAPELVISWAMRQWLVSRRIAKDHQRTQTHGFFALMGGFVRFNGTEGPYTLSPSDLKPLLQPGDITEQDIKDMSKSDALSKGFAILQTTWFILQCIARQTEHLHVTELEIVTVAFAVLNLATYTLWWNKPVDVRVPFIIGERPFGEKQVGVVFHEGAVEHDEPCWLDMFKRELSFGIAGILNLPIAIRRTVCRAINRRNDVRLWDILLFPFYLYPIKMLWEMWSGINSETIQPRSKRVPTFYSGAVINEEQWYTLLVTELFAMVFGGIHCIAWSFHFPSRTEQLLWQMSSFAITCVPALFIVASLVIMDTQERSKVSGLALNLLIVVLSLLGVLYALARVTLLVLAFTSLRSLPIDAYRTVHWTTFIPHI